MEKEIVVKVEQCHLDIFSKLRPWFGKDESEVIRNLAVRWVESNIGNENVVNLIEIVEEIKKIREK